MKLDRFQRHSLIDWFSQDEVRQSFIAVVGCGAVGNEVIKNLALLGVGKIDIYDFDVIELHNLTRSVLFREEDIGRKKVDVVAERVQELDSQIEVTAFHGDFWDNMSLERLPKYDCVVCCVDNFEARLKLNKLCYLFSVDFINTGIDSRFAEVATFPFSSNRTAACYECNLPFSVYERISKRYSCGWLKKVSFIEKKIPTTIITSSISGAYASSLALRLGSNDLENNSNRLLMDTISGSLTRSSYSKNESCPTCSLEFSKVVFVKTDGIIGSILFSDIKDINDEITIITSEPIITKTRCVICHPDESNATIIFDKASKYDDSITICPQCNNASVDIEIKDTFLISELLSQFEGFTIPTKYFLSEQHDVLILHYMEDKDERHYFDNQNS